MDATIDPRIFSSIRPLPECVFGPQASWINERIEEYDFHLMTAFFDTCPADDSPHSKTEFAQEVRKEASERLTLLQSRASVLKRLISHFETLFYRENVAPRILHALVRRICLFCRGYSPNFEFFNETGN